jgi:hypothetical protein
MMTRRWRVAVVATTVCVVLGVAGASALAAAQLHRKQQQVEAPSGEIVHLENRAEFIATHSHSEKDGAVEVPAYKSGELLMDNSMTFFLGRDSGFYRSMNARTDLFDTIETLFPSTALRKGKDGDHVYVMYDTEDGERLFLFFSGSKNKYRTVDGFPILMAKALAYGDFAALKVGDNMDAVSKLDPVVAKYKAVFDTGKDEAIEFYANLGAPPTTVHLLTDGVLKIEYARKAGVGYVITDLVYSPDFTLEGLDGQTNYAIAKADYVK